MTLWSFNGGAWFSNLSEKEQHRAYDALRECEQLPYIIELHCASGSILSPMPITRPIITHGKNP
jgi:hypothetical protein